MSAFSNFEFDSPRELVDFFLHHDLFRTKSTLNAVGTGKSGMIFRGQADSKWQLLPTAFRDDRLRKFTPQYTAIDEGDYSMHQYLGLHLHAEAKAIRLFLENADALGIPTPIDYSSTLSGIQMMQALLSANPNFDLNQPFPTPDFERATALAQHHGVPTRFLDWTESPLIACFFAAFGASIFSNSVIDEGQNIVIFFMSTNQIILQSEIGLIKAPRHENSHMLNQRGVFTTLRRANSFFVTNRRWPSYDEVCPDNLEINRATLPASKSTELLKILFDLDITRHSLMPTLDNASKAFLYAKTLFGE